MNNLSDNLSIIVTDIQRNAYNHLTHEGVMRSFVTPRYVLWADVAPKPLTLRQRVRRWSLGVRDYFITLGRAVRGDVLYTEDEYDDAMGW